MPIVLWVVGSLLVGFLGRGRVLGFWGFFLGSLVLSPILCLLLLFITRTKEA